MAARVLCFVALSEAHPASGAAVAACAAGGPHQTRPLPLAPAEAPPAIREVADRLAEYLHLRSVAHELATLAVLVSLLREQAEPVVVAHAAGVDGFMRLIAAADLARDRLAHERPAAGTSTLAAQRAAAGGAELPVLAAAAAAGDVLRAPELSRVGLFGNDAGLAAHARSQLALVGVPCAATLLSADPSVAAAELIDAPVPADIAPRPVLRAGDDPLLRVPLGSAPAADLRAVRAGSTLALHASGATRRLTAPAVLGARRPGRIEATATGLDVTLELLPDEASR